MTPDPRNRYQSLLRLCHAAHAGRDLASFFRPASEEVHALTGCDCVSVVVSAGRGVGVEFAGLPRLFEIPGLSIAASAAGWVLQHRQPRTASPESPEGHFPEERRLFEQGYRTCVSLPLLCRGEIVGVLGLAGRRADGPGGWDR